MEFLVLVSKNEIEKKEFLTLVWKVDKSAKMMIILHNTLEVQPGACCVCVSFALVLYFAYPARGLLLSRQMQMKIQMQRKFKQKNRYK